MTALTSTPLIVDNASVSTPGEFVPVRIVLGATTAALVVSTGPTVLRGWYINTTLGAYDVYLVDATGRKYKIPAGSPTGWNPFVGDVSMDGLMLDHDAAATGTIVLSVKVF